MQLELTVREIGLAVGVFALLCCHVAFFGLVLRRLARYETDSALADNAILLGSGLVCLSAELFLCGYLNAWNMVSLLVLSAVSTVGVVLLLRGNFRFGTEGLRDNLRSMPLLTRLSLVLCLLSFVFLLVMGLRAPYAKDEVDYHWAGPVLWANAGHWILSPLKFMNSPCLAELLYLFGAIFNSPVVAHWTHTLFLFLLVLSAAALSRRFGGSASAGAIACLSVPVIVTQAPLAYNDLAAGALCLASFVPLLCTPSSRLAGGNLFIAGLLLAGAISTKPITIALLPVALTVVAFPWLIDSTMPRRLQLKSIVLLLSCCAVAGPIWLIHTKYLTGSFTDPKTSLYIAKPGEPPRWDKVYIASDPSDVVWTSGAAAGRVPRPLDVVMLPAVPFITSILGQQEPYGGRTGLLLMPFGIAGMLALRCLSSDERRRALVLLSAAAFYFVFVGAFFIKTRFHIFSWAVLACFAAIGFQWCLNIRSSRLRCATVTMFFVLCVLGMADAARTLFKH